MKKKKKRGPNIAKQFVTKLLMECLKSRVAQAEQLLSVRIIPFL